MCLILDGLMQFLSTLDPASPVRWIPIWPYYCVITGCAEWPADILRHAYFYLLFETERCTPPAYQMSRLDRTSTVSRHINDHGNNWICIYIYALRDWAHLSTIWKTIKRGRGISVNTGKPADSVWDIGAMLRWAVSWPRPRPDFINQGRRLV